MKNWIRLTVIPLLALLAACQADYTQEAMLRAREFALEHTRLLPETARNYIRYTTPKLQFVPIFAHEPMRLTEYAHIARNIDFNARPDPNQATIAAQFVWTPPELGYSIIALGHSRRNLDYWEPHKVILKNIVPYKKSYELARKAAVSYVTNKMLYLSNLERLRVNSSEAEVRETSFDLEYMFEEQLQGADYEWRVFLDTLTDKLKRRQFSLIWPADDKNRRIVVTGLGSVADLERWIPACGMVIPASQLDEYTVEIRRKAFEPTGKEEMDAVIRQSVLESREAAEKAENVRESAPAAEKNGSAEKAENVRESVPAAEKNMPAEKTENVRESVPAAEKKVPAEKIEP